MVRTRKIAGRPVRSGAEAWDTIADLSAASLASGPNIDETEVRTELGSISGVMGSLVNGKHLDNAAVEVSAGELHLEIFTVSGDAAFKVRENLNPVPGAATASDWEVRVPAPELYQGIVVEAVSKLAHVSISKETGQKRTKVEGKPIAVDPEALRRVAGG
jgi:hypothetical protein